MLQNLKIHRMTGTFSRAGLMLCLLGGSAAFAQQSAGPRPGEAKVEAKADDGPKEVAIKGKQRFADAEIKVFALKHAAAKEAGRTLDNIVSGVMDVRVVADERTNSLLIAADPEKIMPRIASLIDTLDQPVSVADRGESPAQVVKSVKLGRGAARAIVGQINELLLRNHSVIVNVVADPLANTIWVSGPAEAVGRFVEVINEMDHTAAQPATASGRELRFYPLKDAMAQHLAPTLSRTAELMALDAEIIADPPSETLIALATPEAHTRLQQIIATLDVPAKRTGAQPQPPQMQQQLQPPQPQPAPHSDQPRKP